MSDEKTKVDELLKRIDELTEIFKILTKDLEELSNNLRNLASAEPKVAPLSPEPVEPSKPSRTIDDVQKVFPLELAGMLYFEETDDYVLIRPRQYLGSDNFAKIASIIRDQLRGEYISAGRESHFRVARKI